MYGCKSVSEVAHRAKKHVVTCNQRTFQSAVVQKYASGTTSIVEKNDYREGKHHKIPELYFRGY